jgi:CO/xanthine dehydrogenase Mo-binding subunit
VKPTQPQPSATEPRAIAANIAPAVDSEKAPAASSSPAAQRAAELARADLARRLGVDTTEIELLGVQQRWKPTGASDTAGQANGWSIDLAVGAKRYRYQVEAHGQLRRLP